MKNRIVAVLVTYNPDKEYLMKDILSLISDVEKIIICNNSSFKLEEIVKFSKEVLSKIEIYDFLENLGIAKAQNIGMKKAFDDGADFVVQMDQDTIFEKEGIKKLEKSFVELRKNNINVGVIGGRTLGIDDYGKKIELKVKVRIREKLTKKIIKIDNKDYKRVKALISSGSLISKDAYYKIGGMMEKLFIDLVDTEYCWRMKKYKFEVIQDFNVVMFHQTGAGYIKYKRKKYLISAPIRNYYQIRNELYLLRLSYAPLSWKKNVIKSIMRKIFVFPKIMEKGELRKRYIKQGIKDFFSKKMGKIDKELI